MVCFGYEEQREQVCTAIYALLVNGAILLSAGYYLNVAILFVPASIVWAGPAYGIRYVLDFPSDVMFALIGIVCAYPFGLMGTALGRFLQKSV